MSEWKSLRNKKGPPKVSPQQIVFPANAITRRRPGIPVVVTEATRKRSISPAIQLPADVCDCIIATRLKAIGCRRDLSPDKTNSSQESVNSSYRDKLNHVRLTAPDQSRAHGTDSRTENNRFACSRRSSEKYARGIASFIARKVGRLGGELSARGGISSHTSRVRSSSALSVKRDDFPEVWSRLERST